VSVNPLGVGKEADVPAPSIGANAANTTAVQHQLAGNKFSAILHATLEDGGEPVHAATTSAASAPSSAPAAPETLLAASFEASGIQLSNVLGKIGASQAAFDRFRRRTLAAITPVESPSGSADAEA